MKPLIQLTGGSGVNDFARERRFVVLTTAANPSVETVHHRMPVVAYQGYDSRWVNNPNIANNILQIIPPILSSKIV